MKYTANAFVVLILLFCLQVHAEVTQCSVHLSKTVRLSGTRKLEDLKDIRMATYNMKDMGWDTKINQFTKSEQHLHEIKEIIDTNKIDFLILEEVENAKVLEEFNKQYLNGRFKVVVLPGNDNHKIAYLINDELPLKINFETFAGTKTYIKHAGKELPLFSRDLPAAHIRYKDHTQRESSPLIILGTHFKSQRSFGADKKSIKRRTEQVLETSNIIRAYEKAYPESSIFLAGDFNANIHEAGEFKPLFENNLLKDSFDLSPKTLSTSSRTTHSFHPHDGAVEYNQIDGILANKPAQKYIHDAEVVRYQDSKGVIKELPSTYEQRDLNPSDHYMVLMHVDLERLLTGAK